MLRFSTSRDQGLGDALPAGTVRVYQRDARGNPQFVGESRDRPHADGLGTRPRHRRGVRRQGQAGGRAARAARHRPLAHDDALHAHQRPAQPVTVDLIPGGPRQWGDTRIIAESHAERAPLGRRSSGGSRCRPMARRSSPPTFQTRATERPMAGRAPCSSCCSSLAAAPARGADGRDLGRGRTRSRSPSIATRAARPTSRSISTG